MGSTMAGGAGITLSFCVVVVVPVLLFVLVSLTSFAPSLLSFFFVVSSLFVVVDASFLESCFEDLLLFFVASSLFVAVLAGFCGGSATTSLFYHRSLTR